MTTVDIRMRTALEGRVEIKGHCQPLVCAAVSTLVGAVLNVLQSAARNVRYESGDVVFDVQMVDAVQVGAFEVLCTAFEMLSSAFSSDLGVTMVMPEDVSLEQDTRERPQMRRAGETAGGRHDGMV